jgi:hypothetical protein
VRDMQMSGLPSGPGRGMGGMGRGMYGGGMGRGGMGGGMGGGMYGGGMGRGVGGGNPYANQQFGCDACRRRRHPTWYTCHPSVL